MIICGWHPEKSDAEHEHCGERICLPSRYRYYWDFCCATHVERLNSASTQIKTDLSFKLFPYQLNCAAQNA